MDTYKIKFTVLQQEILRFLFVKAGQFFTKRKIASLLGVSPTAVANSLKLLEKEGLVDVRKGELNRFSVGMNRNSELAFAMKRAENLKMLYESGLDTFLAKKFPAATIILFGSYSFGEDVFGSDIDLAIIKSKEKETDLATFEKALERRLSLHFFESFGKIPKNLKESLLNGIILKGSVEA